MELYEYQTSGAVTRAWIDSWIAKFGKCPPGQCFTMIPFNDLKAPWHCHTCGTLMKPGTQVHHDSGQTFSGPATPGAVSTAEGPLVW